MTLATDINPTPRIVGIFGYNGLLAYVLIKLIFAPRYLRLKAINLSLKSRKFFLKMKILRLERRIFYLQGDPSLLGDDVERKLFELPLEKTN